ncbi:MAG: DUF6580 family putative transport protein [Patescibacteria group bacterium]
MKIQNARLLFIFISVITGLSVAMRFLPHSYNFVPVGALALFSGTYIRSKWGVLMPVAAMAVTDVFIGWHNIVLFTWGSYAVIGMIGWWVRQKPNVLKIAAGTVSGSVIFYLLTNFAVWAWTPLYQKTWAGLIQSYVMAVPFYRNTFFGDLFYVAVFFGVYQAAVYLVAKRAESRKPFAHIS